MGDMKDYFSELDAQRRAQKASNAIENKTKLSELRIIAVETSDNVFRLNTRDGTVMFYPSTCKWQHKGKVYHGNADKLKAWLDERKLS